MAKAGIPLADKPLRLANVQDVTEKEDCVFVPLIPLGNQAFLLKVVNQIDALLVRGWRFSHCRDWLEGFLKPEALRRMEREYASRPVSPEPGGADVEGEVPSALVRRVMSYGLDPLPATKTHRFRMHLKSGSSNRLYVVSQRISTNGWECSCPGWCSRRRCRHLEAIAPVLNAPEFRRGVR